MKKDIHPDYMECTVKCSCGNEFTTRATKPEMRVDICNVCHPFYSGTQKLIDTGGRVQRFSDRFGSAVDAQKREAERKAEKAAKAAEREAARKEERAAKAAAKAARKAKFEDEHKADEAIAKADEASIEAAEADAAAIEAESEAAATEVDAEITAADEEAAEESATE